MSHGERTTQTGNALSHDWKGGKVMLDDMDLMDLIDLLARPEK